MRNKEKRKLAELRGADAVGTPGAAISKIPSWFDQKKFKRAQEVFKNYYGAVNFAHFCGLLMTTYFPKILKTLRSTGESDTMFSLFHRYIMTIRHIQRWYEGDIWNPDDAAHKSIVLVRSLHAAAGKQMALLKDGQVYVSQWDMMIVQWLFIGPIILFRSRLGFHGCQHEDYEALVHFWRTIGYLLGIQEKYNLCSGEYDQVHRLCNEILKKECRKVVAIGHPDSITMGKSMVSAMSLIDWLIQWSLCDRYIHKLVKIPWPHTMNTREWICYGVMCFLVLYVGQIKIMRHFYNDLYRWKVNKAEKLDLVLQSGKHPYYKDIKVIYSTS